MAKKQEYGNESIKSLKGADRVRKRPAVIFGSDGLEGCEHSVFEIMSNSIDEAREGYGNKICVTRFLDGSVEVQDFGRGIPVDYNKNEDKYNWELLFCEMYAGGKYDNGGDNYEFSLGLNGLGLCATQYASEYMEAEIHTDGYKYTLHFEKGENIGGLKKEKYDKKDTGTRIKWKPDLDVFTDINIPIEYFQETIKRQAIVNDGVKFVLKNQTSASKFETFEYCYNDGKKILPTEKGIQLIDCVPDDVKSPKMTAVWETALQHIEKGAASADEFMNQIEDSVKYLVDTYSEVDNSKHFTRWETVGICPKCGQKVLSYPKSYSCENKECDFVVWKNVRGKNLSVTQVVKLLTKGKTDTLKGLKSKLGESFDAAIKLNSDFKTEFVFSNSSKSKKSYRK